MLCHLRYLRNLREPKQETHYEYVSTSDVVQRFRSADSQRFRKRRTTGASLQVGRSFDAVALLAPNFNIEVQRFYMFSSGIAPRQGAE